MVLPIILAGGAWLTSFIAKEKHIISEKTYKNIIITGFIITTIIIGYIIYKLIQVKEKINYAKETINYVIENPAYVPAAALSGLLGGGTSPESYEKAKEAFIDAPQKPFENQTITQKVTSKITDIVGLTPQEYILTDCDRLVAGNPEFMSEETKKQRQACIEAGYKDIPLDYGFWK